MLFFRDTDGAGVPDEGFTGFRSIFGADASDTTQDDTPDDDTEGDASGADDVSPEESDDGLYTTAEDVVATRLAAAAGEDADDEPEQEEPDAGEEGPDFASLSDQEKLALFAEYQQLKADTARQQEEARTAAVAQAIAVAESTVSQTITAAFQQQVLGLSAQHYTDQFQKQMAAARIEAQSKDDPEAWLRAIEPRIYQRIRYDQQQWEREQAEIWEPYLAQQVEQAKKQVPELRQHYAEYLAGHFNLPPTAVQEIMQTRDGVSRSIDEFQWRAQELADLAQFTGSERKKTRQAKQKTANQQLRNQPIRTTTSSRSPGGKLPEYKGTEEEGLRLLKAIRSG